jgi:hypothetical protein
MGDLCTSFGYDGLAKLNISVRTKLVTHKRVLADLERILRLTQAPELWARKHYVYVCIVTANLASLPPSSPPAFFN